MVVVSPATTALLRPLGYQSLLHVHGVQLVHLANIFALGADLLIVVTFD